jgi:hypothetical protein
MARLLRKILTWPVIECEMFGRWVGETLWFVVRHPLKSLWVLLQGLRLVCGRVTERLVVFSIIDGLSNRR